MWEGEALLSSEDLPDLSSLGGDYWEAYASMGLSRSVLWDNGRLEEIESGFGGGISLRVLKDGVSYMSCVSGLGKRAASRAFSTLRDAVLGGDPGVRVEPLGLKEEPVEAKLPEVEVDVELLRELDGFVRKGSGRVLQVSLRFSSGFKAFRVLGSLNNCCSSSRVQSSFTVQVVVGKDGMVQTASERVALSLPPGKFWLRFDPFETCEAALKRALELLEASPPPAGPMPVVLSGKAGGTMIHEACGHGLEADIVKKDFSVYRDRLGEEVASPLVTLIDDGSIPELYGSSLYDDEGFPTGKTVLIEGGILRSYLSDVYSYLYWGFPITGNGRRASYSDVPMPRMTNTYLAPGSSDPEEIVASVDEGLYVALLGGGEVNPTTGDFVFHAEEAYLIEGGKVGRMVKGAILAGNGPKVLKAVRMVGNDLRFVPGVCGKDGQGVPVSDGQPTLLVDGIVVGGSLDRE